MIDDTDSPFAAFLSKNAEARQDTMCRVCHDRPSIRALGMCQACNDQSVQRWALTPTNEDE